MAQAGGRFGISSIALAAALFGSAQSGFGQVRPRQDTVRRLSPVTSPTSQVTASEAAAASALASALQKVGVDMDPSKVAALTQAIIAGGNAGVELAFYINSEIAEVTKDSPVSKITCATAGDPTGGLSWSQCDPLIQALTQRPDTTLALSRYVRGMLIQVRTVRPRG